jgi:hypothetical protein
MTIDRTNVPEPTPRLTARQEAFARELAKGVSYAEAYRAAGLDGRHSTAQGRGSSIHALAHHPAVVRRVAELQAKVDQEPVAEIAKRMAWLRLIIAGNPAELTRVVRVPCNVCWTDKAIAQAWVDYFATREGTPFQEDRPQAPDVAQPQPGCPQCDGAGYRRVVLTPTEELSPASRALFKTASENEKGVIKVEIHDQMQAADMLNKMQSVYISRSMNLNANVAVQAARDASPEQALALFDAFGPQP